MKNNFTCRESDNKLLSALWLWFVGLLLFPFNNTVSAKATDDSDDCIMQMTTVSDTISFYVGSSADEEGVIKVDLGNGKIKDFNLKTSDTIYIKEKVNVETVKIYGSKTLITYLQCINTGLTSLNTSKCENLELLICQHNIISNLDVKGNKKLLYLDCQDNSLETLDISQNKELLVLYAQINTKLGNIDFSNNTKIREIVAYGASNMTSIDVSNNPELLRLSVDQTSLSSIDVSKNKELLVLNIGLTKITSIDVSKNTKLRELYLDQKENYKYYHKTLDVTNNPDLMILFASYNRLTDLNLSKNPKLRSLFLSGNNLSNLDLSNNKDIVELIIRNNYFTYNTLPLAYDAIYNYTYFPQKDIVVKKEFSIEESLDLSASVYGQDYQTSAEVYLTNSGSPYGSGSRLVEGVDYTYENGVLKFLKTQSDSVYCSFKTDKYPGLILKTTRFLVLNPEDIGKSSLAVDLTTDKPIGETFAVTMSVCGGEKNVEIDFGDSKLKEFTLIDGGQKVSGEIKGRNIKIYTASEVQITDFEASGMQISDIKLNNSRALQTLNLQDNNLSSIDLSGNLKLTKLMLDDNKLTRLNVKYPSMLTDLSCDNNLLESIVLEQYSPAITHLSCSNNKLTDMSFVRNAQNLQSIDCSQNEISEIMLTSNTSLREIDLSNNKLKNVDLSLNRSLEKVNLEGNYFTFSTLPEIDATDFFYGNQKDISVADKTFMIDLSSEAVIKDKPTSFVWKTESGNVLAEGVDYVINGGKTTFINKCDERVYAELTNEIYPELILKTSLVNVLDKPDVVLASFVSSADEGHSVRLILAAYTPKSVYVDFGDGELKECRMEESYTTLSSALGENKTITIYGYDESYFDIKTLSMSDVPLTEFDITKLKDLYTLTLSGADLNEIELSNNSKVAELTLSSNNLAEIDLSGLTALKNLSLSGNKLKSIDLSNNKELTNVFLGNNEIENLSMPELPNMYKMDVSNNKLKSLDVTKCPILRELSCSGNYLSTLDLSGQGIFSSVNVSDNKFQFNSLPVIEIHNSNYYRYYPQKDVEITVDGGRVDLSSEYMVAENPTVYTWTTESGATLVEGTDYTIDNGVTTFMKNFDENVYCSMTNAAYPELTLKTIGVKPETTGIGGITSGEGIKVENGNIVITVDGEANVLVCNTAGMMVRSFDVEGGTVVVDGLAGGVYMIDVRCGSQRIVKKVMLK